MQNKKANETIEQLKEEVEFLKNENKELNKRMKVRKYLFHNTFTLEN